MTGQKVRLLSVDWDYFFPDPIKDPLVSCLPPFADCHERATQQWLFHGRRCIDRIGDIPMTSGDEGGFWQRFQIFPAALLFIGQEHRFAAHPDVMSGVSEVWNFDAHADAGGYESGADVDGTWLTRYASTVAKHVRYPSWKTWAFDDEPQPAIEVDRQIDDGKPIPWVFDRIFICRGDNLTPPWIDQAFLGFLKRCPIGAVRTRRSPLPDRAAMTDALMRQLTFYRDRPRYGIGR